MIAQRLAVPAERGTSVEVRDLFFNTPARLKFLKSPATELGATLRAITQLALAQPAVQFRVAHNGRAALTAPAAKDLRERAGAVWGWPIAQRLLRVDRTEHGLHVHGVAGPPDLTRGGRDDIVIVVNGRPVRDPALLQAALAAYRPLLARDRFPLVVVAIDMPAADVDANVHPTKAWVRFRHPRLVQEMLLAALRDALRTPDVVPTMSAAGGATWTATGPSAATDASALPADQHALFAETPAAYMSGRFGRVLGQVQDTFIVATTDDEVFFLDQHVVHERVLFERLESDLAVGAPPSQALLFPETVDLPPAARALLERWRPTLERLGFAFDSRPDGTLVVSAVPALLKGDEPRRLLEQLRGRAPEHARLPGLPRPSRDPAGHQPPRRRARPRDRHGNPGGDAAGDPVGPEELLLSGSPQGLPDQPVRPAARREWPTDLRDVRRRGHDRDPSGAPRGGHREADPRDR